MQNQVRLPVCAFALRCRTVTRGFTAVELLTVIAIVTILTAISSPAIAAAMRRSRITSAGEQVLQVAQQARVLALATASGSESGVRHGVVVSRRADGRYDVAMTWGSAATVRQVQVRRTGEWMNYAEYAALPALTGSDGQPQAVQRAVLPTGVEVVVDGTPLKTEIGWMYQPRTGVVVASVASSARPVAVGTASSPICHELMVRSLDGRIAAAMAIYEPGMAHLVER